jgi:replication factor C subunit 2/4
MTIVSFTDNFIIKKEKTSRIKYIPWVEKYRPSSADQVIVSDIIRAKINSIIKKKDMSHLIITGDPGTGKTSTVKCIARELICKEKFTKSVLELNASDERGLNMINNTIIHFCEKKVNNIPHKIVILDEADSITPKAQNLLTNILESYINTTRFAFICNDITKIEESIQSKCMIMNYPKMRSEWISDRIRYIISCENIHFDEEGMKALIYCSNGDIRQAINYLECIHFSFGIVTKENVFSLCRTPKPELIKLTFKYIKEDKFTDVLEILKNLHEYGYSPNDVLSTMINMIFENYNIDLNEEQKINYLEELGKANLRFNEGSDSFLQLVASVAKIFNK